MRAGSPNSPDRHGGDGRQIWGAPSSSRGRRRQERSPSGPSRREAGAHTRGAAARRARGSGAPRRTQLEPPAPVRLQGVGRGTAGRARGRDTKAEKRPGAGGGRCVPSGGLPRTIDPGGWAVARARGRRDDAIPCPGARSGEGCLSPERGSRPTPRGSRPAEQAGGARCQPRAPDARGPLCAGRAPGPALRAATRSGQRRCPRRGESARPARCQSTINAGPRPTWRSPLVLRTPRLLVGLLARRSSAPVRHWAPQGGASADR